MKEIIPLSEIRIVKQRIGQLVRSGDLKAAAGAVESFANRLGNLSQRINRLPYNDRNAIKSVLYTELETVLMRFEELESLGPQSGPVLARHDATKAIHSFGNRSDKLDKRLERLPIVEKLATAAILHRELEEVVKLFEQHEWMQHSRSESNSAPQSRSSWN